MATDAEKAARFELFGAALHKKAQRERAERQTRKQKHLREVEREMNTKKAK